MDALGRVRCDRGSWLLWNFKNRTWLLGYVSTFFWGSIFDHYSSKFEFYEYCIIGKKIKVKFGTTIYCIEGILDYVHMKVWGPIRTTSLGGMHYFMSLIDDFFRRCWVYTMKHKGEALDLFVEWKKHMKKHTWRKFKILHSDNGGDTQVILFYSYVVMRTLRGTSQLKRHSNKMWCQRGQIRPCWRRFNVSYQILDC